MEGYKDSAEQGVVGYGGRLNIRPEYQREFIYSVEQQQSVIESILRDFPLNGMYWLKMENGNYELLDGQQRTLSICRYVNGSFAVPIQMATAKRNFSFNNLTKSEKEKILNYKLMIYVCSEGDDRERLDWFAIINIVGAELTRQELRNTIYTGEWLSDAKKYFSKPNCPAKKAAGDYLKGKASRQDYLETVLKWISAREGVTIEEYMGAHKDAKNCNELWLYFKQVFDWVKIIFPNFRKDLMRELEWGILYNKYGNSSNYDAKFFESEILRLIDDEDVTNNRGIYEYLFDKDEKHLSIRKFTQKMKRAAYEKQKGVCAKCGNTFAIEKMHADHILAWSKGGRTTAENCQLLCADCNRRKSNK
ncbi:MAG: DUF262 domain-containing protein [Selenomonadaceae bacterium]|nr:DUF262 domain-containing protein [Selenomonadaceae bacterium]